MSSAAHTGGGHDVAGGLLWNAAILLTAKVLNLTIMERIQVGATWPDSTAVAWLDRAAMVIGTVVLSIVMRLVLSLETQH
jgi:hypothetical protein